MPPVRDSAHTHTPHAESTDAMCKTEKVCFCYGLFFNVTACNSGWFLPPLLQMLHFQFTVFPILYGAVDWIETLLSATIFLNKDGFTHFQ